MPTGQKSRGIRKRTPGTLNLKKAAKRQLVFPGRSPQSAKVTVRKALLGLAETKRINGATIFTTVLQNQQNGVIASALNVNASNTTRNLTYTSEGTAPENRVGDKIYGKDIHLKMHFQMPDTVAIGITNDAYTKTTAIRVIVFETDRDRMLNANYSTDLLAPPYLFADTQKIMADLDNQRYRILKDHRLSMANPELVWQGQLTDEYNWMPEQLMYETTVSLNKNITYSAGGNEPDRMVGVIWLAQQDQSLGNGVALGVVRVSWTFTFKDV
ncbi:MAG: putative capsid protein [Cressdnaviricota sp.]|nr:MAG: putative capsid protein [Cressdnaviricota sp.]